MNKALITAGTLALSGIGFTFAFGPIGLIPVAVVAAHEFGHYFAAHADATAQPSPPVFIPFPPLLVGLTSVKDITDHSFVSYAGPVTGLITSVLLTGLCLALSFYPGAAVAAAIGLFEFVNLFWSSDARKARLSLA
jgi:branched-subunit amino acid ABC-type transport system permease component